MDGFLPELQVRRASKTEHPAGRVMFAFLLVGLLSAALIAGGCTADSMPAAESDDDGMVPAEATTQDADGAAAESEPATEAASASAGEAEPKPETASDPESAPDEAVVEEPPDWTTHAFVDGGYYVLGNPDAEVSILDAGDFL